MGVSLPRRLALAVLGLNLLPQTAGLSVHASLSDPQCHDCACASSSCVCYAQANGSSSHRDGTTDSIPAFFVGLIAGSLLMRAMATRRQGSRSQSAQTSGGPRSHMLSAGVQTLPPPPPASLPPMAAHPTYPAAATVSRAMQTVSAPITYSMGSQTRGAMVAHVSTQFSSTTLRNAAPLVSVSGDAGIARGSLAQNSQVISAAEDQRSLAPTGLRNSDWTPGAGRSSQVANDSPSTPHRHQTRPSQPPQQHAARPSLPPPQRMARQSSSLVYKERMDEKRPFALSSPVPPGSPMLVREGAAAPRSPGGKRGSAAAYPRPPELRVPSLDEQLADGESSRGDSPYAEYR